MAAVAPLLARVPSALERGEYCARAGHGGRHRSASRGGGVARGRARRGRSRSRARGPRRTGPEERNLRQLARCLVEHPALARRLDRDELAELLPAGVYRDLIAALADAAEERPRRRPGLAASLEGDARNLSMRSPSRPTRSRELAARTIDDTFEWLRDQQRRRIERDITRRLRSSELHPDEKRRLLEERQRLLHERQRAWNENGGPRPLRVPPA